MTRRENEEGPKSRVFVSSVVEGFKKFRQSAREGIDAAGGEPVLVNEDFPAQAASSRNVCLDAVASCDYLIIIIGARGGWTAPSGKLVVEEEFEEARRRKIPVFAFVQSGVTRDAQAEQLVRTVSAYLRGHFRVAFEAPDDLREAVRSALEPHLIGGVRRTAMRTPRDHLDRPHSVPYMAMLRFVLTPERDEEVVDPVGLSSEDFRIRILELGHSKAVKLFDYAGATRWNVERDALIIEQSPADGRHGEGNHVLLRLFESGELVLDLNVSGRKRRGNRHDMLDSLVLAVEDIEEVLRVCFAMAKAMFDEVDPFGRHQTFWFNAALSGLGHRQLERNPQPRSSFGVSMRGEQAIVTAHEGPRRIGRTDLSSPDPEIKRAVIRFEQKLRD